MNTKLTLNIDKEIIEEAKIYAKSHQVSLSKLIENYLNSLTRQTKKQSSVSLLVESLTGIIPNDYDEKKDYRNYIDQKYS
jgi:glutamate synthase domain-containing protein 3